MQTCTILVTEHAAPSTAAKFKNMHVTYVANSNVFLTDSVVYVAINAHVTEVLQNYVSNVLHN